MVTVPNAIIRHKGLLADNTTSLQVYLPELTAEQDAELIQHSKFKESAIIIMDPNFLDIVQDLLEQAKELSNSLPEPEEEETEEESWETDPDTGFDTR